MTDRPKPFVHPIPSPDGLAGSNPTLVHSPSETNGRRRKKDRVVTPEDRAAHGAMNCSLVALISGLLVPAISPLLAYRAVRRAYPLLDETGHGLRTAVAVSLGVCAGLCGLVFYLLWGLLRPVPVGLVTGWVGLRRLPAVNIGFQRSADDPFGWSPASFHWPAKKGK